MDENILIDDVNPKKCLITAIYLKSFAFKTLNEKIPKILQNVIENLNLLKNDENFLEVIGQEEINDIVAMITKFTEEIKFNNAIVKFDGKEIDYELWNSFISSLITNNNRYYTTCFLYSECYIYRRLKSIFNTSINLKNYDYFQEQKTISFTNNIKIIEEVFIKTRTANYANDPGIFFIKLLKISLWSNRWNMPVSDANEIKLNEDIFTNIDSLDEFILVNDSINLWHQISQVTQNKDIIVDFILDNSGFEIIADFLLAEFLIEQRYATKIRFYTKSMPWFISNVTRQDIDWILNYFEVHSSIVIQNFGRKLSTLIKENKINLETDHIYWTSPYEFFRMKEIDPVLYKKLSSAKYLFIKGDLNYRKLIGDFNWPYDIHFKECLRGFYPTTICSLRTVESEVICGIKENVARDLNTLDPNWMLSGKYGLITCYFKKQKLQYED